MGAVPSNHARRLCAKARRPSMSELPKPNATSDQIKRQPNSRKQEASQFDDPQEELASLPLLAKPDRNGIDLKVTEIQNNISTTKRRINEIGSELEAIRQKQTSNSRQAQTNTNPEHQAIHSNMRQSKAGIDVLLQERHQIAKQIEQVRAQKKTIESNLQQQRLRVTKYGSAEAKLGLELLEESLCELPPVKKLMDLKHAKDGEINLLRTDIEALGSELQTASTQRVSAEGGSYKALTAERNSCQTQVVNYQKQLKSVRAQLSKDDAAFRQNENRIRTLKKKIQKSDSKAQAQAQREAQEPAKKKWTVVPRAEQTKDDAAASTKTKSRSKSSERERPKLTKLEDLELEAVLTGTVKSVAAFGAFVSVGAECDGLVHISDLSGGYVASVDDVVTVGDSVEVRVKEINLESRKLKLSMKPEQQAVEKKERRPREDGAAAGEDDPEQPGAAAAKKEQSKWNADKKKDKKKANNPRPDYWGDNAALEEESGDEPSEPQVDWSVAERTISCEQLTNLLVNKMPRTKESTPAEQESARSSELTDAYQKGSQMRIDDPDSQYSMYHQEQHESKKSKKNKRKAAASMKDDPNAEINFRLETLQQFASLKLTVPTIFSQIPAALEALEAKKAGFEEIPVGMTLKEWQMKQKKAKEKTTKAQEAKENKTQEAEANEEWVEVELPTEATAQSSKKGDKKKGKQRRKGKVEVDEDEPNQEVDE